MNDEQLMADLMKQQQGLEEEASKVPLANTLDEKKAFAPRAIRIKNKVIGQKELADLNSSFNQALDEIASTAQFKSELEMQNFKNEAKRKFNNYQLQAIEAGYKFDSMLKDKALDADQRLEAVNSFGLTMRNTTAIAFSQLGRGPQQKPAADTETPAEKIAPSEPYKAGFMGTNRRPLGDE